MPKHLASNIIALTGSWITTIATALMQNVGFEIPELTGSADWLSIVSGLAASALTFALARKRWLESEANSLLIKANARKQNAEARVIELDNKEREIELLERQLKIESSRNTESNEKAA